MVSKEEILNNEVVDDEEIIVDDLESLDVKIYTPEEIIEMSDNEKFAAIGEEIKSTTGVSINGKKYIKVAERLSLFKRYFSNDYSLVTDVLHNDSTVVVFKASIYNVKNGILIASGHSEKRKNDPLFKASFEFAETSAIGRALSSFGIIGDEFASSEEMTAVGGKADTISPYYRKMIVETVNNYGIPESQILKMVKLDSVDDIEYKDGVRILRDVLTLANGKINDLKNKVETIKKGEDERQIKIM